MEQDMNANPTMNLKSIYKIGAITVLLQLAAVLALLVGTVALNLGPRPATVLEFFLVYHENRLVGLLRDDFSSLVLIALYLGWIPAIYFALRKQNFTIALFSTMMVLVGVAVAFAIHSSFSMMHLSDLYAAATSEAQRSHLLAAGEAVLASDLWNSTGGYLGGILLQGSGVLISLVMLRGKNFSKVTAISGLLGNGLDLFQHLLHPFVPGIEGLIQPVMGIFYLVWFPMLARDLLRLARSEENGGH